MKPTDIALIGHPNSTDKLSLILRQVATYDIVKLKNDASELKILENNPKDVCIMICNARNVAPCCQMIAALKKRVSPEKIIIISEVKDADLMFAVLDSGIAKFVVGHLNDLHLAQKIKKEITSIIRSKRMRNILAIGAHPDDVEIGCGGTLKKHSDRGDEVTILTLTKGAQGGDKIQRERESQCAADSLDAQLIMCDLIDTKMSNGGDTISSIYEAIDKCQPDIIYTHSLSDTHQDHRATHYATLVAARKIERVYAYLAPSGTIDFHPRYFEHIEDYIDDKMKAINCFTSQTITCNRPYLKKSIIQSTAQYWGRFSNYGYVEPFEVIRA